MGLVNYFERSGRNKMLMENIKLYKLNNFH